MELDIEGSYRFLVGRVPVRDSQAVELIIFSSNKIDIERATWNKILLFDGNIE